MPPAAPASMPPRDPVRAVLAGTATRYILLGVNIALGVFLMPFTLRHLGTAEYGLWMLVASMTYYFQLLDLGYGSGLVRHLSDADARADVRRANEIVSTFAGVYAGIGLAAAAGVAAVIVWVIPRFPNLQPGQIRDAQVLLALMGVRIAIGFPMTIFGAVTTARQRFAINNVVAIAVAVLNATVTWAVLSAGHGLLTLVASTTALSLASYGAYAWTAYQAFPELTIRPSAFNRAMVREVTAFSIYLFLIDIAIQIGFNLDNVVVGAALGTSAVAIYSVALRVADYQRQLCNQFNGLLFPVVVRLGATGSREGLTRVLIDGTRIALTLVVGVTLCVTAFGAPLVEHWVGPGFEASVLPLYVLALMGVVLVGQGPLGNVLLGTGRHRLVALTALGEALANLALSLFLVRRLGLLGVAIGTAVPVFVANLFILAPAACRQVDVSIVRFIRLVCVAPAVGVLPAAAVAMLLQTSLPPASLWAVVAEGAVTGMVYLATVVAVGFEPDIRREYGAQLRRAAGYLFPRAEAARI